MLSIQKKFLFIHIPKTGGNSIQNILKQYSEDNIVTLAAHQDGIERFEVRNEKYNYNKHATLYNYSREIEPILFNQLYKFAVVRNPWDRMISNYFSPHRNVTQWNRNDFIKLIKNTPSLAYYINKLSIFQQFQFKFNKQFVITKELDTDIDFFIRFENIEEDFRNVCKQINIPHESLPHRNKSNKKHYSTYYDEELKNLVHTKFRNEIDFFDYNFEMS